MIHKTWVKSGQRTVARVTFMLPACIWASEISLVADFNNWSTTAHPLRQDSEGRWTVTVDLESGRTYEFRYLSDRRDWMNESQSDGDVRNPYGSRNSVVSTDPDFRHGQEPGENPEDPTILS